MNKIVGRVADRSACNRKENRIKRALNGAIIHGNGGEGVRRNAQSGLRGVSNDGTVDVSGHSFKGRLTRARNYDDRSFLILSFSPSLFRSLSLSLWARCGVSLSRRAARRERARKNAAGLRNSIWPFDARVCKCKRCGVTRGWRYINCARREMTGESRGS